MKKWTAVDLFAGGGGLTLGLKNAGFYVVGAIEIDPLAANTYRINHPEVNLWERDIRLVSTDEVKRDLHMRRGQLDMLAGCPPCQGFTSLRTHNGSRLVDDPRNALVSEFTRFVRALNPKVVMLENVPGLANDPGFQELLAVLDELKYSREYRILDAAYFGVPQRRKRLILLAGRFGPLPFASASSERFTVRHAIGNLPKAGASGDALHDQPEHRSVRVQQIIQHVPRDGGSRTDLPDELTLACHQRVDGFKDVYGRLRWDEVASTITSGCINPSKGRFLHPEENRTITLREAAILQGFPPAYKFDMSKGKSSVAAIIGNALPPEFIRRHAIKAQIYLARRNRVRRNAAMHKRGETSHD